MIHRLLPARQNRVCPCRGRPPPPLPPPGAGGPLFSWAPTPPASTATTAIHNVAFFNISCSFQLRFPDCCSSPAHHFPIHHSVSGRRPVLVTPPANSPQTKSAQKGMNEDSRGKRV